MLPRSEGRQPPEPLRAILIVRLGALGDIVHALPVAAALRAGFPEARLDWVVDERYQALLELVPVVDHRIVLRTGSAPVGRRILQLRRTLRDGGYDLVVDAQGLLKSAVVARLTGAARVAGFPASRLREPLAARLYTETHDPGPARHVVAQNLALAAAVGGDPDALRFPLQVPAGSPALATVRDQMDGAPFALINPGAAWPNKRWLPDRFGAVARRLRERYRLRSVVTWGPADRPLAEAVVAGADGGALLAPATGLGDLAALLRAAAVVVSGDTGPLHLACALGTPVVALHGPTDPARNGPWSPDDVTVSRYEACRCRHRRRCRAAAPCLDETTVDAVTDAVHRRLEAAGW